MASEHQEQAIATSGTAPLSWLHEAEDDIGTLAHLIETLAAQAGQVSVANKANTIGHRWTHRRSLREQRATDSNGDDEAAN